MPDRTAAPAAAISSRSLRAHLAVMGLAALAVTCSNSPAEWLLDVGVGVVQSLAAGNVSTLSSTSHLAGGTGYVADSYSLPAGKLRRDMAPRRSPDPGRVANPVPFFKRNGPAFLGGGQNRPQWL